MQDLLVFLEKINIFLIIFQKKKEKFYLFFMKEVKIFNIKAKTIMDVHNSEEKNNKVKNCRIKIQIFKNFLIDYLKYKKTFYCKSYMEDLLYVLEK